MSEDEVRGVVPSLILFFDLANLAEDTERVRVLRDRGTLLERDSSVGPAAFLVTVHPSSILRTPAADRDAAYAALVADLKVVAAAVA